MGQTEPINKELEFNIGEDEEETTVEMNEDGTEAEISAKEEVVVEKTEEPPQPPKKKKAKEKEDAPSTDNLDDYSDKVKKRIDKLTARLRETQRREEAAMDFAKSVQQQNEVLQEKYHKTDGERLEEANARLDSHVLSLKHVIKKAREEGDIDTETEAQQRLTSALVEQDRVKNTKAARQQAPVPPPQAPAPAPAPQAVADPKAEEWAEQNEWFGKNTVMTHAVRGIHLDLIRQEGFDPSTDEYYDEINRRMREIFPNEYEEAPTPQNNRTNRPVQTVAPATRSSGVNSTARRTVRLTPSQVAIAKRLGVSLEDYAKHVKE